METIEISISEFNDIQNTDDYEVWDEELEEWVSYKASCYAPVGGDFPKADEAKYPINLITIYDSLVGKYHTWGLGAYSPQRNDVIYHNCQTEGQLLMKFANYWAKNYPDIMTGWNSDGFDIPYIVNRMERLFGEKYSQRLSPTNRIWSVEKLDRFNNPIREWTIQGISCIDYMKAYKKFTRNERENYTLDYIGGYEGVGGKIDYEGSLAELSISDWTAFVDYNIRDVEIIVKMEAKLHFLELCRMIAYRGLTKFEKALATNNVVGGAFALQARKQGYIIPTFQYEKGGRPPGGLVRYPENGFSDDIVSFDAKSLYPNTIISLNLSPETKLGQSHSDENFTYITTVRGKEFRLSNDDFKKWMVKNKICKSMHGTLFTQHEKGIIPNILEGIYSDRIVSQKKKNAYKLKLSKLKQTDAEYLHIKALVNEEDIMQYTLKILMNSLYGTFGNHYSVLYDLDMSASITLTGQESNLQASLSVQNYIKDKYGCEENLLIYGDTDSLLSDTLIKIKTKKISFEYKGKSYILNSFDDVKVSDGDFYMISNLRVEEIVNEVTIEELYGLCESYDILTSSNGHEIMTVEGLSVLGVDGDCADTLKVDYLPVKRLVRHNVSKGKWKLTTTNINGDYMTITTTEDHGMVVCIDGILERVTPKEILENGYDTVCINEDGTAFLRKIYDIEKLENFDDEYVYDIEMKYNPHTFFGNDILVHNSIYITLRPLLNHIGAKLLKDETRIEGKPMEITDTAMSIINDLGGERNPMDGLITKHLSAWALREMNSLDPRFMFAREKISKSGIFMNAKKRYAIQVVDNEGIPVPVGDEKEFSITGIEGVVSSTNAKEIQELVTDVIKTMVITKDQATSNAKVIEICNAYYALNPQTLAVRKSVKDLKKYEKNADGFNIGKGTPQNSKASLLYNTMIDHLTLGSKYEKIKSGDKIKILYVAHNRYGLKYIGFKDELPKEFNMMPDYRLLYLKNVHPVIERIFEAVSWDIVDPTRHYNCDILSEFS